MEIIDPCTGTARYVIGGRCKAVQLSCVLQWEGVEVILFNCRKFVALHLKASHFSKVRTIILQVLQSYGAGLRNQSSPCCHRQAEKQETHSSIFLNRFKFWEMPYQEHPWQLAELRRRTEHRPFRLNTKQGRWSAIFHKFLYTIAPQILVFDDENWNFSIQKPPSVTEEEEHKQDVLYLFRPVMQKNSPLS